MMRTTTRLALLALTALASPTGGVAASTAELAKPTEPEITVAFEWGLGGPVSAQRFAACSPPPTYWNGFVGGFFLRDRSACVPLLIQVGQRSATVRFGIGRRCSAS